MQLAISKDKVFLEALGASYFQVPPRKVQMLLQHPGLSNRAVEVPCQPAGGFALGLLVNQALGLTQLTA